MPHDIPFLDELPGLRERLARVRILYSDLDGTLLGRGACLLRDGAGEPALDAATAVTRVLVARLPVVVTSGRNAKQLLEVSRLLGFDDFIAEVGAVRHYRDGDRTVRDTGSWPAGLLREGETPYEAIVRTGALEALCERFPGRIEHHAPWHLDREVTHVLRGNVPADAAREVLEALPLPVALIDNGIIHPPRTTLTGVEEVHAYHLVPAGVSKARAIAADLAERGWAPEHAMAIGDSAGDVGMADSVGLFVSVHNGLRDPVLLEHAARRAAGSVAVARGANGAGWAELAAAWLEARA